VELVEDRLERLRVVGRHRHPAVRLHIFVFSHVELLDVEGAAEIHHRAETALHRPAVDDVALDFDGA